MNWKQNVAFTIGVVAFLVFLYGGLLFGGRPWSVAWTPSESDYTQPSVIGWLVPPAAALALTVAAVIVLKERKAV